MNRQDSLESGRSFAEHLLMATPTPIPISRPRGSHASGSPTTSPQSMGKRFSHSHSLHAHHQTPPTFQASSVMEASALSAAFASHIDVDSVIQDEIVAHRGLSHSTPFGYFWNVGKLSEFTFSDRFVRSNVFDIPERPCLFPSENNSLDGSVPDSPKLEDQDDDCNPVFDDQDTQVVDSLSVNDRRVHKHHHLHATGLHDDSSSGVNSSWRLRLYPHGRGDRYRESDHIGLYLHLDYPTLAKMSPSEFTPSSGRRLSWAGRATADRYRVSLFLATTDGTVIARKDFIETFSGTGPAPGLGFPRFASRKSVEEAVRVYSEVEEDYIETDLIVGALFQHEPIIS
ncbi:hypothetical protein BGZ73_008419 [Actinomortierella ambigua]|nr:hypothetical protein BGZ73_008419 [Actinomortierella ambigua]